MQETAQMAHPLTKFGCKLTPARARVLHPRDPRRVHRMGAQHRHRHLRPRHDAPVYWRRVRRQVRERRLADAGGDGECEARPKAERQFERQARSE